MKRIMSIFLVCMMVWGWSALSVVSAEEAKPAIYAADVAEGTYENVSVTSSSSMFKIVDCTLHVTPDGMTADMTLSGTGYEKLYMGTGEEALAGDDADCIYFVEGADGMYTYTIPVEALDKDIDCAAWSIRKQQWYDRVIVFESNTLPDGAVTQTESGVSNVVWIGVGVCFLAAFLVIGMGLLNQKKKNKAA